MAPSSIVASPMPRVRAWLGRWGDVVPLLLAEFIVWLGFGALLPVLPLYFTEQGVDLALLGLVIAAWPAARLIGEPVFGYLADRTARVPLMVIGLVATGVFSFLPLVLTGPLAFVLLRTAAGLATSLVVGLMIAAGGLMVGPSHRQLGPMPRPRQPEYGGSRARPKASASAAMSSRSCPLGS
jgi:MFS family permease